MDSDGGMIQATEKFKGIIAECVSDAVGNDIRVDIKRNGYVTGNGNPFRIWDFLNTNLSQRFDQKDVFARPTKRGPWSMIAIFDNETGFLYCIMREARFEQLKRELPKRRSAHRNAHYEDALVQTLNMDLRALQPTLFVMDESALRFDDAYVQGIVQNILHDLNVPNEIVRRHALILFSSAHYELTSLRCCVLDSNLNIVCGENWNSYIKVCENIVVDEMPDPSPANLAPAVELPLKQKAKDRIGQKRLTKMKKSEEKEKKGPNDGK